MLEMIHFLYWFSLVPTILLFIILWAYPIKLKIFRDEIFYKRALILFSCQLIIGFVLLHFDKSYRVDERHNLLIPLWSVTFLLLYKIANKLIYKKYGRPMYYGMRYSNDEESQKATFIEVLIQGIIMFLTIAFPFYLSMWIVKNWYSS